MDRSKKLRETKSGILQIVKNTLGNKCNRCGGSGDVLHHPEYKNNMTIKDLELLCNSCHKQLHAIYRERRNWSVDILNLMKSDYKKTWSLTDLSENLGISKALVLNHIKPLIKEGRINEEKGYMTIYKIIE